MSGCMVGWSHSKFGKHEGVELETLITEAALGAMDDAGVAPAVVVEKVAAGTDGFGYNARTDVYEDLFAAGVLDPTKVTRTALENACSVSGLLITAGAIVVSHESEDGDDG